MGEELAKQPPHLTIAWSLVQKQKDAECFYKTSRVFCLARISKRTLAMVAGPFLMVAADLLPVCSPILTVRSHVVPILMPFPSIGS